MSGQALSRGPERVKDGQTLPVPEFSRPAQTGIDEALGLASARLMQPADEGHGDEVEKEKRKEINAVPPPVKGPGHRLVGPDEIQRDTPHDRGRAQAEAGDHREQGEKMVAPHLRHRGHDDPDVGEVEIRPGHPGKKN